MTPEEMKRLDKRINEISAPFGTGFPVLRGLLKEAATRNKITDLKIMCQYIHWKWSK